MKLTVKELKQRLENCSDDAIICIERIEDVYFEKHGWKTKNIIFQKNKKGEVIEDTDYLEASSVCITKNEKEIIILAHI